MSYPSEIQVFFEEVASDIIKDLDPEYIIITGSFGKLSWLFSEEELFSDFELVFVCKEKWSLKKKKKLLERLNKKYEYDISLKGYLLRNIENGVISNYSRNASSFISLDFFDTFSAPSVIYSKHSTTINSTISIESVPNWEAWRLLVNRIGDLLSLLQKEESTVSFDNYYWLKIFESIADAYLIINNLYSPLIGTRHNIFTKKLLTNDSELCSECVDSFSLIEMALNSRSKHDLFYFDITNICLQRRYEIVCIWMKYIEKKVCISESINHLEGRFIDNYYTNTNIQKKYLETGAFFGVIISNLIRLLYNYKVLLKADFKYYKLRTSWRHIILLTVISTFYESKKSEYGFLKSKTMLSKIYRKKRLENLDRDDFISLVIKYWKILR